MNKYVVDIVQNPNPCLTKWSWNFKFFKFQLHPDYRKKKHKKFEIPTPYFEIPTPYFEIPTSYFEI